MKVLIANYRYFVSSGPERYLFNVASRLEAAGHQTAPFSIRYAGNAETPFEKYFVSPLGDETQVYFEQHSRSPAAFAKTMSRLFYSHEVERAIGRMADEWKPDVAYILYYLRKLSPSLLVGLKKRGVPIVARLSDYGMFCPEHHCLRDSTPCTLCIDGDLSHSVKYGCVKGSRAISALDAVATGFHRARGYFDLIDVFVTTNPFMHDMMRRFGVSADRLRCIPTFTDTETFSPPSPEAPRTYLLCLGRLDPPKGIDVLIEAMAMLRARLGVRTPMLKIVGAAHEESYGAELKALAERLGVTDLVHFHGRAAAHETPGLFRGALCSILPARWFENLPNSLVESFACGTPVIASDIGSLAASIVDGEEGLLARPGDAADFAAKIERFLGDPSLQRRLGLNARRAAESRFSGDVHIERLLDLFSSVTSPRPAQAINLQTATA